MRPLRAAAALCCLPCAALGIYRGDYDFKNMSTIPDLRNNFCSRLAQVNVADILMKDALAGMHLQLVTMYPDSPRRAPWFNEPLGNEDPALHTGFHVRLADRIAAISGFTYTLTSIPRSNWGEGFSFSDYLAASLEKFDVSLLTWTESNARANAGFRSAYNFIDMTIIPYTIGRVSEPSFWEKLTTSFSPLHKTLWGVFFLVSFATSVVYCIIERGEAAGWKPHDDDAHKLTASCFMGLGLLTKAGPGMGFAPQTAAGKVLVLTFTFFILLLTCAYTANLAAALVVSADVSACNSFEDCTARGGRVCVWKGTAEEAWFIGAYPTLVNNNQVVSLDLPWDGLRQGQCELAIADLRKYNEIKVDRQINPDCMLRRVGETALSTGGGGWMNKHTFSASELCSGVLREVLSVAFLQLALSGELQDMWGVHYKNIATQKSCAEGGGKEEGSAGSWPIESMLGPLVIHAVGMFLALALFFVKKLMKLWREERQKGSIHEEVEKVGAPAIEVRLGDIEAKLSRLMDKMGVAGS